ncbi:hypothetical protein Tco_0004870 [Tanacetum coccineum]
MLLISSHIHYNLPAVSASSYAYVSLLKHFLPIMNPGLSLTEDLEFLRKFWKYCDVSDAQHADAQTIDEDLP